MPKQKILSGADIAGILKRFGFETVSQRGSHVKLRRTGKDGARQTITIPFHDELDKGTVRAIYRQALRYVPEDQLAPHFYTDSDTV